MSEEEVNAAGSKVDEEESKPAVIELNNIEMPDDRGGFVFRGLSIKIEAGCSAIITGAAGSGKTTLVDLLLGLKGASSGSVELFGDMIGKRRGRVIRRVRQKIGGVGGHFRLVPSLTVAENITLPLVLAGERRKVQKERLLKALSEFSLLKQAGEYPQSLTRVESTLAQFARASIAHQPLLIIDEPAALLDARTWQRVHEYLVKVILSGRSLLILTSETLQPELPKTDQYNLSGGVLT
ncbi:MAG: ATP-binding cassette domain-containing protein [candidate division Zixibacteria bacterium]